MKNIDTENPYLNARREWNERYGDFVKAAATWRLVALISAGVSFLAVAGAVYIGSKSKLVPYVIETDSLGRIASVGVPEQRGVDERVVRSTLSDWIGWHRSVVTDGAVQRLYIEKTYAYLLQGSPAKETLDRWYIDGHDPFVRMQSSTITVQVQSVLLLSGKTYQIEWSETEANKNGEAKELPTRYRGLLTIETREVDSLTVLKNPLGLFITTIAIQQIGG